MNKILYIILISLFSLTVISCSSSSDGGSSTTSTTTDDSTTSSPSHLVVGSEGTIFTSSDNGTTWTSRTSGTTGLICGVTYGNSTFVAVGNNDTGTIFTSPDGTTWTSRTSGTTNELWGVTFGNNTFVAGGWFFYFSFSCELLVISIISKIILPKKVFQFIFPTEKFSGNQTWDCILRNPNAKSL